MDVNFGDVALDNQPITVWHNADSIATKNSQFLTLAKMIFSLSNSGRFYSTAACYSIKLCK